MMLLAALLVPWALGAQQTLTVCDGTGTNTHFPVNGLYTDTRSACNEFIIPSSLLGDMEGGTITEMTFYLSTPAAEAWTGTIQMYLGETTATSVASFSTPSSSAVTVVYTGLLDATDTTMTVTFSTPYEYNGGNLLIGSFISVAGNYKSATFKGEAQADFTARYRTSATAAGTQEKFIPKTTFSYIPAGDISCYQVRKLRIDNSLTTPTSMTLTWSDTSNIGATYTILNMADSSVIASGIEDTVYTISTLTSNTSYRFGVYAKCAADDSSRIANVTGRTPCEAVSVLPFIYGFEDATTTGATGTYSPCWARGTNSTTAYPYPNNSQKRNGVYSLYMYSATSNYSYTAMPAFVENINNLYLNFWALKTSAAQGFVTVGVMSNPDSVSTFDTVAVFQVQSLNTWEQFDVDFSAYEGTGRYIAFMAPKGVTNYVYIDDITVMQTPACVRPQSLVLSDVMDDEATITWTASPSGANGYTVMWSTLDFDPETSTTAMSATVTDTTYTITGLNGQTGYYVKVAANCTGGNSLWSEARFTTRCPGIVTLPYNYGFEDASGSSTTSTINSCWIKGTNSTTAYPYPNGTTYKHSGTKNLYFYSASTTYSYAAMPAMAHPIDSLMVTFWGLKTSASYGHITVGVMTNPDDINTFEAVAELQVPEVSTTSNQQWKEFEVPLVNYRGHGRYIAFYCPQGATNNIYIDDIKVDYAPDCLLPENIHAEDISGTSATIAWTPAGSSSSYVMKYDSTNFNPTTATDAEELDVTGSSIELNTLEPNTTYYVYMRTVCDTMLTEWSDVLTFTTPCELIEELPWSFEPDSMATTSTATEIECFGHIGGGYVNIATRTDFTGNTVRFYPNSNAKPNIFILPEFETSLSNLYMAYKTAPEGTSSGSFSVGYITDAFDSTTFVELARYPREYFYSTGSVVPAMLDQTFEDAPQGARIAFRHNVNSTSYYWFLDEITVMNMPTCFRPDSVTASDIEGTEATLNVWSDNSSDWYVYMPAFSCDSCDTSFVASGSSFVVDGLTPGKYYSGMVYGYCNGDTSFLGTPFSFISECATLDLPVTFDAEGTWQGTTSAPELPCWDFLNYGSTTYNWRYSTTASNVHQGTKSFYYYGTTTASTAVDDWMMLPTMNFTGADAISMWVKTGSSTATATYHGHIAIYATVEDSITTNDTANFYRLDITGDSVVNNRIDFTGNVWQFITVNLPEELVGEHRLAFVVNEQTYTFYADEINVYTRSACPGVQDVAVMGISSNGAVVTWSDSNATGTYVVTYWPQGTNLSSEDTLTVTVYDTVAELDGLMPDSVYYVSVQADCGDLSTGSYPVSFRTACLPVAETSLPYVENFDTYGTGSSAAISTCWKKGVFGSTTQYPYPYSSADITGGAGLYFYATSTITSYAAMPLFETPINDLMVSFSIKRPSTATYKTIMLVGVMSNPTDITTFDTVETIDLSSQPVSSVHRILLSLENYEGNGRYIAFKTANTTSTSTYNYVYLDSVVVDSLPACRWPSALVADSVTSNSVYLSWTGSGENYYVEASLSDDFATVAAYAEATENSAVVTGLNDYTQYYFRVRTVCDDTTSFWSNTATAITDVHCGDGYETAYDTISYGTSTSYSYIINGYSSYTNTASWHIYTPAELEGLGMMDTINYIRGISVETGTVSNTPIRFRVYMGTTDLNEWHSATSATATTGLNDTLPINSMELVYNGAITFEANTWNDIAFSTPYLYRADENLVVAFVRDTTVTGTTYFKYGTTNDYRTAYKYTSGSSSYAYRGKYGANIAFLTCNHITTCPKPTNVVASNVAVDGFDLAWTGTSAGYKVVVATESINPDIAVASDNVLIFTPTTNQLSISGLTQQTTYYYYLRSECGDEQSTWTLEANVMTLCAPKSIPYYENFDGMAAFSNGDGAGAEIPCYDVFSANAGSFVALYATSTYRYGTSGYSLKFKSGANYVGNYLVLPEYAQPISELELSFQTRPEGTSASSGSFDVGYITDINDSSTFVVTDHYVYSDFSGAYKQKTVYFTGAPAGARIAMRHVPTGSGWFWFVDEIDVHEAPTCFRPDSVTVAQRNDTAIVRWYDSSNDSCSYEVEYGEAGFAHGTGISQVVNGDSLVITGLLSSRYYEVYVRSICAADDITGWTDAVAFSTPCGLLSLPYSNDWERESTGSSNLALCWNSFHNAGSTAYPYINTTNVHNGTKSLYFYFTTSSGYATDEAYISPAIDTVNFPIDNIELSFWAKSTVAGKKIMVGVMSGTTNMSTFTLIDTIPLTTTYAEYFVNTAAYTGNGDRIVLRTMMEGSSSYSVYVDELIIDKMPPCPRVNTLTATGATPNSALLGWTDTVANSSWLIEYKAEGSQVVNTALANSNPFVLTGLQPSTLYIFRVAPICAGGDTSDFSRESGRFTTTQVPAQMPYSYDFENAAEWANWGVASNNNVKWYRSDTVVASDSSNVMYLSADGGATNSWRRNTITNVAAYRDIDFGTEVGSYEVKFRYHGGGHKTSVSDGISVMVVDPSVEVVIPSTYLGSPWGNVHWVQARLDTNWGVHTASIDGVSGVKRLVFYHFNNAVSVDSLYVDVAPAIDDINIVPQECVRPYDLVTGNITPEAATFSWTGDSNALYMVNYWVDNTTIDVYDTVTGLSYTAHDLVANTTYKWQVRKVCVPSLTEPVASAWSEYVSFKTLCGYESLPFSEGFETTAAVAYNEANGVLPDCWDRYSNGTDSKYLPHVTGSGSYHYPHLVDGATAGKCLTMTGGSATYGDTKVVALPPFSAPVRSLSMKFWYKYESTSYGELTVGYITDRNDLSGSFIAVKPIAATTMITQDSVTFEDAPANALQLAFRYTITSTSFYSVGIDDIEVWGSAPVCEAPDSLVADATYNSSSITWRSEADSFEVVLMAGAWSEPSSGTVVNTNTVAFSALEPNVTYAFGVRALCGDGFVSDWAQTSFTTEVMPCFKPESLAVSNVGYNTADVTFTPGEAQSAWQLHLMAQGVDNYIATNVASTTLTGLVQGTAYQLAVRALCGEGDTSDWSDTVSFTMLSCDQVTGVTVSDITGTTARISWNATGAASYIVEYAYQGSGQGQGTSITVSTNYVVLTGLDEETSYDVYVRSVCAEGVMSVWSAVVNFTTEAGSGPEPTYYTITVLANNNNWGTVAGGGSYLENSQQQISATPNPGYHFVEWQEDGVTDSVRTIVVTGNMTFTAVFAENVGIEEATMEDVSLFPNPASSTVTIRANGMEQVSIIDLNGRTVMAQKVDNATATFDVSTLAKGTYFVRIVGEQATAVRKLVVK